MKALILILALFFAYSAQAKKTHSIDFNSIIEQEKRTLEATQKEFEQNFVERSSVEQKAEESSRENRIVIRAGEARLIDFSDRKSSAKLPSKKTQLKASNADQIQEEDFSRLDEEIEQMKQ